ncbi:MAG: flagellar brake protein [Desulfovibrionaceae bacterium]
MPSQQTEQPRDVDATPSLRGETPALDMQIGARVLLQLQDTGEKLWGETVGMVQDKFIIIRIATNPAIRQALQPETPVAVRYVVRDCLVFGFTATVARLTTNPLPLLYLHFPASVETANLRTHHRVCCYLPATLFLEGQEVHGALVDISRGGCRILVSHANDTQAVEAPVDTEVFCQLNILGDDGALFLKGVVKKNTTSGDKTMLGVAFDDITEEAAAHIERYVQCVHELSDL